MELTRSKYINEMQTITLKNGDKLKPTQDVGQKGRKREFHAKDPEKSKLSTHRAIQQGPYSEYNTYGKYNSCREYSTYSQYGMYSEYDTYGEYDSCKEYSMYSKNNTYGEDDARRVAELQHIPQVQHVQ
ncbi:MAG: hypothetical protein FRX48_03958 [Lasallia pustulata]|uniref:Uncharacterized protein n=1 Tax=Lasallia pustulata TaxID=136370 RepID=A0A5M8PS81_9LECA|nr:MAG: hypothetical protein FRX48_03958 [Lasallia pustulata]